MGVRSNSHLEPGTRFGAYEIVRELGEGAYGVVYEALRLPLRNRVALKLLHASVVRNENAVARFFREAEAAAQLRHPNIVEVYDFGSEEQSPYMAMEFLEGEPLDKRLKRLGRLSLRDAADLLLPVVSAVAAVHEHGIVHRDLKPGNIFIARGPRGEVPKLLDFGIAKVRESNVELTNSSAMIGTPVYMSPEQVHESKHVDARSDLWSLGVIAFECVTGARPFAASGLLELLELITHGPIPCASAVDPTVPSDLNLLIQRLMERDLTRRIQSARAAGQALLPYASERIRLEFLEEFGAVPATEEAPAPRSGDMRALPSASTLSAEVHPAPSREKPAPGRGIVRWVAIGLAIFLGGVTVAILGRGVQPSGQTTDERPAAPAASRGGLASPVMTTRPSAVADAALLDAASLPLPSRAAPTDDQVARVSSVEDAGPSRSRRRREREPAASPMYGVSPPSLITPMQPVIVAPITAPGATSAAIPTTNGIPNP